MGRVPADGRGVAAVHPVGPGAAAAGAGGRAGGGRRLPAGRAALVPGLARALHPAVPAGLRLRLRRVLARRHAHTDHFLEGVGPATAGQ